MMREGRKGENDANLSCFSSVRKRPVWCLHSSYPWAFGPPVRHAKSGRAGVLARQAVRTGWKACATGRTFQDRRLHRRGPTIYKFANALFAEKITSFSP